MSKNYPYLKYYTTYRNWLVKFVSDWTVRDVYNHRNHAEHIYDKEGEASLHRKGMRVPGGYTMVFRAKMLRNLLATEQNVVRMGGSYIIEDAELDYIQKTWIEEGDFSLTAKKMAEKFGRKVKLDERSETLLGLALFLKKAFSPESESKFESFERLDTYSKAHRNNRYYAQMAKQLIDGDYDLNKIIDTLNGKETGVSRLHLIANFVDSLPVENGQFFPSPEKEARIRREWENDQIGFLTALELYEKGELKKDDSSLFGYDDRFIDHIEAIKVFEEKGDIIDVDNDLISLEEKCAFFDDFREKRQHGTKDTLRSALLGAVGKEIRGCGGICEHCPDVIDIPKNTVEPNLSAIFYKKIF